MRKLAVLAIPLLTFFVPPAQAQKSKTAYKIEFDPSADVEQLTQSPDGTKKAIFVRVHFSITLDGADVGKLDGDYKLVIEEDGKEVKRIDVPRPKPVESISVMLALDTSGSMKENRRMEQARIAAEVFLKKLPERADCGLILFDHEVPRKKPDGALLRIAPIFEREPLMKEIRLTQPRGGTAYLDATSESIAELRKVARGRQRAVVVMTDGADTDSRKKLDATVKGLHGEDGGIAVFTLGYGDEPNQTALGAIARAGAGSFSKGDVDTIVTVFRDLASFF
jgi:hypothetical protein